MASSSTSAVTELNIAKRFHTLSKDYNNRPVVARRNTVPALLRFLQHQDREVRVCAAEAILNLSDHPENPNFLCNEKGFVSVVFQVYRDSEVTDPEVHAVLAKVFEALRAVLAAEQEREREVKELAQQALQMEKENMSPTKNGGNEGCNKPRGLTADGESARFAKNRRSRVTNSITACRNMLVEIDGADEIVANNETDRRKSSFEEILQTTRGVVSYSVDWDAGRANLFLSTPTTVLVQLMEDSGFKITVAHEGEPVQLGGVGSAHHASKAGPSYLRAGNLNANIYDQVFRHTLVLHGSSEDNTLATRLQRQKEDDDRKKAAKDKSHVALFVSKLTAGWW